MGSRDVVSNVSKPKLCLLCWTWVIALGVALVALNLHTGHALRAKVVGLLMVFGASVYAADMASTVYARNRPH